MYEGQTFEAIMERCMDRVATSVDKREGAIVYDAVAQAAAELAILYIELEYNRNRGFPDTAAGQDLTDKCKEGRIFREAATCAIRKGYFEGANGAGYDPPIGSRFSGGGINFAVIRSIGSGQCQLQAETAGAVGNGYIGTLYPIDSMEGLTAARLADILIPGEDEEDDETLRRRYLESLRSWAFGGNMADYRQKVLSMQGVGGCKVLPVWAGGGTVLVLLVDSEWKAPSDELISAVKNALDPAENSGQGYGMAPIGHSVTVRKVLEKPINVSLQLSYASGISYNDVKQAVEAAIQGYFQELVQSWADSTSLTVRISQIENRILDVEGIVDIGGTSLNGSPANAVLNMDAIPVLGSVTASALEQAEGTV